MIRAIYSLVMWLAAPVAFAIVLLRGVRDRAYWERPAERFGWGRRLTAPALWLHAVSMGEVAAAVPQPLAETAAVPQLPAETLGFQAELAVWLAAFREASR